MQYRTVYFTVQVDEPTAAPVTEEDEARRWVGRELRYEQLLEELHAARTGGPRKTRTRAA